MNDGSAARVPLTPVPGASWKRQDAIRDALTRYIIDNELEAGSSLPSEAQLVAELGVSRNALREAVKVLDALGIVEVRHGYGTYVGHTSLIALEQGLRFQSAMSLRSSLRRIRDLLQVREILEVALIARVAVEEPRPDLPGLRRIVEEMETSAAAGQYFPELDWRFHEALYERVDNVLLLDLLRVFWEVFNQIDSELPGPKYGPDVAARWHKDVLAALEAADPTAAVSAMQRHFDGIRTRIGDSRS